MGLAQLQGRLGGVSRRLPCPASGGAREVESCLPAAACRCQAPGSSHTEGTPEAGSGAPGKGKVGQHPASPVKVAGDSSGATGAKRMARSCRHCRVDSSRTHDLHGGEAARCAQSRVQGEGSLNPTALIWSTRRAAMRKSSRRCFNVSAGCTLAVLWFGRFSTAAAYASISASRSIGSHIFS